MRLRTVALILLMASTLVACDQSGGGGSPDTTPPRAPVTDPTITIEDFDFQNGSVTIEAGTTVTWIWEDAPAKHNVVSDDGFFESLQAEGNWSDTFDDVGSFPYHCQPIPT